MRESLLQGPARNRSTPHGKYCLGHLTTTEHHTVRCLPFLQFKSTLPGRSFLDPVSSCYHRVQIQQFTVTSQSNQRAWLGTNKHGYGPWFWNNPERKKKNSDQLGHLYHPQRSLSILIKGPLCCALPYIALVPNSNFPQAAPHPPSEPSPLR